MIKISANDEISSVAKVVAEEKEEDAQITPVLLDETRAVVVGNGVDAAGALVVHEVDADDDSEEEDYIDDQDEGDDDAESDGDSDDDTKLA